MENHIANAHTIWSNTKYTSLDNGDNSISITGLYVLRTRLSLQTFISKETVFCSYSYCAQNVHRLNTENMVGQCFDLARSDRDKNVLNKAKWLYELGMLQFPQMKADLFYYIRVSVHHHYTTTIISATLYLYIQWNFLSHQNERYYYIIEDGHVQSCYDYLRRKSFSRPFSEQIEGYCLDESCRSAFILHYCQTAFRRPYMLQMKQEKCKNYAFLHFIFSSQETPKKKIQVKCRITTELQLVPRHQLPYLFSERPDKAARTSKNNSSGHVF